MAQSRFLAHRTRLLQDGQRALSLADGEGRNSVWLAEQGLEVIHQDPRLLIADESDGRQRLFNDFRGASVSASGGLQQRVAVAGWEDAMVVVEMTTLEKKFVQSYQSDGGNGQLVISSVAQVSEGQPVSYPLVYDRLKPDPGEKQARRNVSAGQGGTR